MKILLASSSVHKVQEIQRMLDAQGVSIDVIGLADVAPYPEPVENGATFEDNALIKAIAGHAATGLPTLADDSGIEVDVLNKMPGVRSARWAGVGATDEENLDLLVRQVRDVEPGRRAARFVCAMAFADDRGQKVVRGVVEGALGMEPKGVHGFGYDPIFVPEGSALTTAEMEPEAKDAISHRSRALHAMIPYLLAASTEAI